MRAALTGCLLLAAAAARAAEPPPRISAAEDKDLNAVAVGGERLWAGGDEGFLASSEDRGRTWSERPTEMASPINDVVFRSERSGLLIAGSVVLATDDAGDSWKEAQRFRAEDFGGAAAEAYSACFSTGGRAWLVGAVSRDDRVVDGLLMSSEDGGMTWKRRKAPARVELTHARFIDEKRGWLVGGEGAVFRTTNGGRDWRRLESGTSAALYRVFFADGDRGWAVGARGTILATADRGGRWTPVASGTSATLLNIGFAGAEGWIVGRSGTVLRSSDGGKTWAAVPARTKGTLRGLAVSKDGVWAAGADGALLRLR